MSITLITAAPGAGKTLHAVWHIIKPAVEEGRVVYTVGIPDLKIPTIHLTYDQVKKWHEYTEADSSDDQEHLYRTVDEKPRKLLNVAEGSLIVIDEVQYCWPASGFRDISEDINYLTKHRHHGLQFVLITQAPQLINKNVLAVVDKHVHMLVEWSGRKKYEWPEYCATPRAVSSKMRAVKNRYDLPKQAYGLYRSASVHLKQERKKPWMFYIVPIVLFALPYMIYQFYNQILQQKGLDVTQNALAIGSDKSITAASLPAPAPIPQPVAITTNQLPKPIVPVAYPVVSEQVDWSKVASCLSNKIQCICYGNSAERLVIPPDTCRLAVRHGWPGKSNATVATHL